jgi:hypothetical protein
MKTLLLILVLSFATSCNENQKRINAAENARIDKFLDFTRYAETHYPGWAVEGFRKDELEIGENGNEKVFYYVLLTKDKEEKIVFLIMADFETLEGTTETRIFEPSATVLQQLQDKLAVKHEQEKQEQMENEAAQAEAESR